MDVKLLTLLEEDYLTHLHGVAGMQAHVLHTHTHRHTHTHTLCTQKAKLSVLKDDTGL